jgi:hypothetical protein
MPSFQLLHVAGEDDLGVQRFAVPDRKVGDEIPLGGGSLRVLSVEWNKDDEVAGPLRLEVA